MRQRHILVACLVSGLVLLGSAMVLVARLLWEHKRGKEDAIETENGNSTSTLARFSVNRRSKKTTPKRAGSGILLPSIAGFVKAGDDGVYSSALFRGLRQHVNGGHVMVDVSLEALYEGFVEAVRRRPSAERAAYSAEFATFLASRRPGVKRSVSLKTEVPLRLKRASLDLERGMGRPRMRMPDSGLVSMGAIDVLPEERENSEETATTQTIPWSSDLQQAQYFDGGKRGISITPSELAALSIILASPITTLPEGGKPTNTIPCNDAEIGAFGISIYSTPQPDGKLHISLQRHNRSPAQIPPPRSPGHSILFAKHIASGCLPFSQSRNAVNTLLITDAAVCALRLGQPLTLTQTPNSPSTKTLLLSLPNAHPPKIYTLTPSPSPTTTPPIPTPLLQTLASLPFTGGLPPLSTTPLTTLIKHIASSSLPPGRLLQRLESLIEKVYRHTYPTHTHSPQTNPITSVSAPDKNDTPFGPLYTPCNVRLLYREQERLGRFALGGAGENGKAAGGGKRRSTLVWEDEVDSLAHKYARSQRYVVLLHTLIALLAPAANANAHKEIQRRVQDALIKDLETSYARSIQHQHQLIPAPGSPSTENSSRYSNISAASASASPRSSTSTSSASSEGVRESLGKQMEGVLKAQLPFSVEMIAVVARLVLVAWCESVVFVGEEDGGFRVGGEGLGDEGREREMVLL